jgi:hypothetical protein
VDVDIAWKHDPDTARTTVTFNYLQPPALPSRDASEMPVPDAVESALQIETVSRMRRGFCVVNKDDQDEYYLDVPIYSRTMSQDLGLCQYPFYLLKECPRGGDCRWRHHPLTPEELEASTGMTGQYRRIFVTGYCPQTHMITAWDDVE